MSSDGNHYRSFTIFRGYETQDLSLWLGIEYLLEDYDEEENVEDDGKFQKILQTQPTNNNVYFQFNQ
jgi:hypothetical protein